MAFLFLHLELNRSAGLSVRTRPAAGAHPALAGDVLAACCTNTWPAPARPVLVVLALFVAGVLVKLVFFDLPFWGLDEVMVYGGSYSFLDALMRLLDFGAMAAFFVLAFFWLAAARRAGSRRRAGRLARAFPGVRVPDAWS